MVEVLAAAYFAVGLYVFYKSLGYFDERNKDGDPEGLDALVSLGVACFWPVTVPIILLYRLFFG
jgi:hypothetical protein